MKQTFLANIKDVLSDPKKVTKKDKEHALRIWNIAKHFMDETMKELPIANDMDNIGNPYSYFLKGKEPGFATKYFVSGSDTDIKLIVEVKIQIPKRKKVVVVKKTKKVKKGTKC